MCLGLHCNRYLVSFLFVATSIGPSVRCYFLLYLQFSSLWRALIYLHSVVSLFLTKSWPKSAAMVPKSGNFKLSTIFPLKSNLKCTGPPLKLYLGSAGISTSRTGETAGVELS